MRKRPEYGRCVAGLFKELYRKHISSIFMIEKQEPAQKSESVSIDV
jgi:hypothetical protein